VTLGHVKPEHPGGPQSPDRQRAGDAAVDPSGEPQNDPAALDRRTHQSSKSFRYSFDFLFGVQLKDVF
jgi:hypothetical protein